MAVVERRGEKRRAERGTIREIGMRVWNSKNERTCFESESGVG